MFQKINHVFLCGTVYWQHIEHNNIEKSTKIFEKIRHLTGDDDDDKETLRTSAVLLANMHAKMEDYDKSREIRQQMFDLVGKKKTRSYIY